MAGNIVRMIGRCVEKKTFWCFVVIAASCGFLFQSHSYRACAGIAVVVLLAVLGVTEGQIDRTNLTNHSEPSSHH